MPFNVWCNGCGHLIGKGVRFNAEKKAVGAYYSTKIWSFSMTAPCCQEHIEVQTDPKNHEYIVVAGARRKVSFLRRRLRCCAVLAPRLLQQGGGCRCVQSRRLETLSTAGLACSVAAAPGTLRSCASQLAR